MDRGAWWATVHGVAKSWTQLKWLSMHCAIFHWCSYHIFLIHSSINGHLCWEAWFLIQMLLKNYWKIKATQWQKKKKKKLKILSDIGNLSKISKIHWNWGGETWTVVYQAPLSMGFSRQESWSGLPCPPQINWLPKGNLERWGDNVNTKYQVQKLSQQGSFLTCQD